MAEAVHKPNLLVRLIGAVWGTFNFVRRLVFGLIALFLLIAILSGLAGEVPRLEDKTALVIAPRGAIVEQYSSDPIERAFARISGDPIEETQLRDIVRALDAAAKDPLIQRVVLVPDELGSAGMATLIEIGAALDRFKTSNKPVIAYGDGLEQRGYYLAAHASKVYLHPEGAVLLEGLSRYRTFFKGAFDKLGVEPRLFRVGEFKSAGEPYIRTEMSPEAREADLYWMGDLWQRYLADVARLRKLDPAKLAAEIDALDSLVKAANGDLGKLALEQGLVDELKTRDQVRAELIAAGAEDPESKSFRQIGVEEYVAAVEMREPDNGKDRVAIVVAEGEITSGDQPPGTVGGDSTAKLIREAREDDKVKALVLRVDSPGGEVFPSELIRREVELTKEAGKPVVISMGDLAASGGYWISMNGDRIIASPSTITGSIGIFGLWFNVPQTMAKLGLNTDGVEHHLGGGRGAADAALRSAPGRGDPERDRPRLPPVHRQGGRRARQAAGRHRHHRARARVERRAGHGARSGRPARDAAGRHRRRRDAGQARRRLPRVLRREGTRSAATLPGQHPALGRRGVDQGRGRGHSGRVGPARQRGRRRRGRAPPGAGRAGAEAGGDVRALRVRPELSQASAALPSAGFARVRDRRTASPPACRHSRGSGNPSCFTRERTSIGACAGMTAGAGTARGATGLPIGVIPAQAGIQWREPGLSLLDPGLRRDDATVVGCLGKR